MSAPFVFRACWPITNESTPYQRLVAQACRDLPTLEAQAHAQPTGPGRFSARPSEHVPGSGRVTAWTLLYECPATRTAPRAIPDPEQLVGRPLYLGDDVDEVVVERILAGEWRLRATRAEKVEVVAQWREAGRSLAYLAAVTGWKPERYYQPDSEAS